MYLCSALFVVPHTQGAQARITQFYLQLHWCNVSHKWNVIWFETKSNVTFLLLSDFIAYNCLISILFIFPVWGIIVQFSSLFLHSSFIHITTVCDIKLRWITFSFRLSIIIVIIIITTTTTTTTIILDLDLVPPVPLGTLGQQFAAILNGQLQHIQPPLTWSRPSANPAGTFCATSSWGVLFYACHPLESRILPLLPLNDLVSIVYDQPYGICIMYNVLPL